MQPGFAMLEAGFTRAKNVGNILMKNLMAFSMSSVGYWAAGFALMYGVSFLNGVRVDDPIGAVPVYAFSGVWGTLAVDLFHETGGLFYDGGWGQLDVQALGVVAIFA